MKLMHSILLLTYLFFGANTLEDDPEIILSDSAELANIEPEDITSFDDSELTNLPPDLALEEVNTTQTNHTRKLVKCKEIVYNNTSDEDLEVSVELINGTVLAKLLTLNPEITSRDMEADCILVLFFSRVCPFSSLAAPHFNAIARAYPNIKTVALDALKFHGINAQYGIVGVPTIKLFHNGRPVGKYNGTEYNIHSFSKFLNTLTGQQPGPLVVLSRDFQGPVSSVVQNEVDYFLVLSWIFIIICAVYYFGKSRWCKVIIESIHNNWRESEAQHEHVD